MPGVDDVDVDPLVLDPIDDSELAPSRGVEPSEG